MGGGEEKGGERGEEEREGRVITRTDDLKTWQPCGGFHEFSELIRKRNSVALTLVVVVVVVVVVLKKSERRSRGPLCPDLA